MGFGKDEVIEPLGLTATNALAARYQQEIERTFHGQIEHAGFVVDVDFGTIAGGGGAGD